MFRITVIFEISNHLFYLIFFFLNTNIIDNKLVVCTGSNRTNFFNNTTPTETSPNTTTIVVGKNPVVIDGSWVTTGTSTTPSVSIYKIPPSFNR